MRSVRTGTVWLQTSQRVGLTDWVLYGLVHFEFYANVMQHIMVFPTPEDSTYALVVNTFSAHIHDMVFVLHRPTFKYNIVKCISQTVTNILARTSRYSGAVHVRQRPCFT